MTVRNYSSIGRAAGCAALLLWLAACGGGGSVSGGSSDAGGNSGGGGSSGSVDGSGQVEISVKNCPESSAQTLQVLLLGDSITEGQAPDVAYRYWLYNLFVEAGIVVDFVGWRQGVAEGHPHRSDYDQDHAGYPGADIETLGGIIAEHVGELVPDIVLLHAGTNDLFHHQPPGRVAGEIKQLIGTIRLLNPNVYIFVAQVIPASKKSQEIQYFNQQIPAVVDEVSTQESPVYAVDLWTGFSVTHDTSDGTHPSESGEIKMAERWFEAVVQNYQCGLLGFEGAQ